MLGLLVGLSETALKFGDPGDHDRTDSQEVPHVVDFEAFHAPLRPCAGQCQSSDHRERDLKRQWRERRLRFASEKGTVYWARTRMMRLVQMEELSLECSESVARLSHFGDWFRRSAIEDPDKRAYPRLLCQ